MAWSTADGSSYINIFTIYNKELRFCSFPQNTSVQSLTVQLQPPTNSEACPAFLIVCGVRNEPQRPFSWDFYIAKQISHQSWNILIWVNMDLPVMLQFSLFQRFGWFICLNNNQIQ